MQMQSRGNPHCQRVAQILNRSTPNLPNLFQEGWNGSAPRGLHDWHNAPVVKSVRELIRHRIAIILLNKNYKATDQLSIYFENLLLSEAVSQNDYLNLKTLNHRLQNIFRRILGDQNGCQHVLEDFQCFPDDACMLPPMVDLSNEHANSTGYDLNHSNVHDTFWGYMNGNGHQEYFSQALKRRPDNAFSNSINYDTSSGCLGNIFIPLKRPKLETSLFSYPCVGQSSAFQRSPELPGQHNSLKILNGEVSVVDPKASAVFTRVSPKTHEVWNNYSNNCLNMNAKSTQVPSETFVIDKDAGKIGFPGRFCQTWENVEKGSGMEENLSNYIALEGWTVREQNSDTMPLPSKELLIDNDPLKIECPLRTCQTWENVEEGYIYFDSSNFNFLNDDMDMKGLVGGELNLGMEEILYSCTDLEAYQETKQNSETIQFTPEAVITDKDLQKIEYSTSTCKTWENIDDPIRNELKLGNLNESTALEVDHGKGQTSSFLIREKEQNSETMQVPPEAVIIEKDPQKIGYSASTCKTWENEKNYSVYSDSTNINSQDEGVDVEDLVGNESKLENFNNYTALEADHGKEQNHGTMPIPSKESIIDKDSQKIGCSTSMCKTRENMEKGSICSDSSGVTSLKESTEGKDEARTGMDEDLNNYSVPKVDHDEIQISEKIKMSGVSLVEFFTEDEIRRHIWSLKQLDYLSAPKDRGDIHLNVCNLCSTDNLFFAPVPLYCSSCSSRIKHHGNYFCTIEENNLQHCLCLSCHKLAVRKRGNLPKMTMEAKNMCKKKNDEETAESWVQCDICERWQHQICALYNDNKDLEGKAAYTCPKCLLKDIEQRGRRELKSGLNAKDLPTTMLSDHIENRLFCSLKKERKLRAEMAGKRIDEVQGVEGLVVRVVSSVEKQLKVKSFWDLFKKQNYPTEFPYRSKVIVVFQNIEGVDVCLFAMYIQEFGLECVPQNRRCVYISYLDSVKYFTPDTMSGNGEALRSFVYHEVMIATLEFFKKRGFASCYLWSCPPLKGEDYIFYCHPKNQKTPKPDKLRKWYRLMLRKAAKEGIVVNVTNLYDHFFVTSEASNLKVTATRLPYFDGDYWNTAAEQIVKSLEDRDGGSNIKGNTQVTKRTLRAMGHEKPSNCSIDDILLMQKLGQSILSSKEDFLIVQLQFFCIRCDEAILSGKRWFCSMCPNFQLCERCHSGTGQCPYRLDTHMTIKMEEHMLSQVEVNIPFIKADDDVVMENTLFDDRQSFLEFCQKNHCQFDTLRRAKHSSMMILNDLHNQNLATVGKDCGLLPQLLQVAQHLSECFKRGTSGRCSTPHCIKMKKMFRHWSICTTHAKGGCTICQKAVYLLLAHSPKCQNLECGIPRCKDLKKQDSSNSHSELMPKDGTAVHSH